VPRYISISSTVVHAIQVNDVAAEGWVRIVQGVAIRTVLLINYQAKNDKKNEMINVNKNSLTLSSLEIFLTLQLKPSTLASGSKRHRSFHIYIFSSKNVPAVVILDLPAV
jgi:hypothetical protein